MRPVRDLAARASACAAAVLIVFAAVPARAQVRPLVTEDAVPLGAGETRLAVGGSFAPDYEEPIYGLTGDLMSLPAVDAAFGLGGVAEVQVSGGVRTLWISSRVEAPLSSILDIPGDRSTAPEDIVIATKVRLLASRGWRPAMAVRFGTKLPNAGNESGLGTDTTDFVFSLLATWHSGPWRLSANLGTGIVGDPSQIGVQHDPTLYAGSVVRAVSRATELAGEVSGRWLPGHSHRPGSEDRAEVRVGVRHGAGRARVDAALVVGLTSIDAPLGVTGGVTWIFGRARTP